MRFNKCLYRTWTHSSASSRLLVSTARLRLTQLPSRIKITSNMNRGIFLNFLTFSQYSEELSLFWIVAESHLVTWLAMKLRSHGHKVSKQNRIRSSSEENVVAAMITFCWKTSFWLSLIYSYNQFLLSWISKRLRRYSTSSYLQSMLTSSFSKIDVYILVGLGTTDCTTTVHRGCLLSLSSPRPPWVSHYWVATRGECWDDWYIWYNLVYHLLWGSSILKFQNYDKMSSQILNQFITKRKDEPLLKV